jgi:hypothetical protein
VPFPALKRWANFLLSLRDIGGMQMAERCGAGWCRADWRMKRTIYSGAGGVEGNRTT